MKDKKVSSPQKQPTDWAEVRRRLEASRAAQERGWAPTPGQNKKILKERAGALAREPKDQATSGASIEITEFLLAYERYGIESSYVREVYPMKDLTPLPCTPPFVLGIINVRGEILSVIDIKKFFDLPEKGLTDLNKVILLHSDRTALSKADGMTFGLLADAILGVRTIFISELQPTLPTLTGIREEYLKGVTKERLVILDAAKLLSDEKIVVNEQAH